MVCYDPLFFLTDETVLCSKRKGNVPALKIFTHFPFVPILQPATSHFKTLVYTCSTSTAWINTLWAKCQHWLGRRQPAEETKYSARTLIHYIRWFVTLYSVSPVKSVSLRKGHFYSFTRKTGKNVGVFCCVCFTGHISHSSSHFRVPGLQLATLRLNRYWASAYWLLSVRQSSLEQYLLVAPCFVWSSH